MRRTRQPSANKTRKRPHKQPATGRHTHRDSGEDDDISEFDESEFPEEHNNYLLQDEHQGPPAAFVSPTLHRHSPNMAKKRGDKRHQADHVRLQNAAAGTQQGELSDDETVDAKTAERIDRLEAENKLLKTVGRRSKKARNAENSQKLAQIKGVIKDQLWRTTKFVTSPAQQDAFVNKCWLGLDYSDEVRNAIGETNWKLEFDTSCLTYLNEQRSYVVSRLRECAWSVMEGEGGPDSLPKFAQIYACAQRKVAAGPAKDLYPWYTHTLIKAACGNRFDWSKIKRCFYTPSTCHFQDNVDKLHIPPSTEAFICVAWDCYRDVWVNQFKFRQDPKNIKEAIPVPRPKAGTELTAEEKKYQAKYTQLDAGSTPMGGWSNEGIKAFDKYCKAIKKERAKAESQQAEQNVLPLIRAMDNITVNTEAAYLKSKRRASQTAQPVAEEVSFEEEV